MNKIFFTLAFMVPMAGQAAQSTLEVDQLDNLVGPFIEEIYEEDPVFGNYEAAVPLFECQPSEQPLVGRYSTPFDLKGDDQGPHGFLPTESSAPGLSPEDIVGDLGQIEIIFDKIINIGTKIWQIVEANKPVSSIHLKPANAVPSGTECWMDIETWSRPTSRTFKVSYRNVWGIGSETVLFKYRVSYIHGGSIDGIGRYLANVVVSPVTAKVSLGYTLDVTATVPGVVNMGTKRNPVAGMQLILDWKVSTALKHLHRTADFFITGDGELTFQDAGEEL